MHISEWATGGKEFAARPSPRGLQAPWQAQDPRDPHANHKLDLATENMRLRMHLEQKRRERGAPNQQQRQYPANVEHNSQHQSGILGTGFDNPFSRHGRPQHHHHDDVNQGLRQNSSGISLGSLFRQQPYGSSQSGNGHERDPSQRASVASFDGRSPSDYIPSSSSSFRSAAPSTSTSRKSGGSTRPSLRGLQKLPKDFHELISPRIEVSQSIIPRQVLASKLPDDDNERHKEVIAHCTQFYLKGHLGGFEVMMPSKIFGNDALECETTDGAPALPACTSEYCWSCGSKLESGATVCHKCNKACAESDVCCGRPLAASTSFCRRCGTRRVAEYCMFCGCTLGSKNKFCGRCGKPRNPPRPPQICQCGQKIVGEVERCVKCKAPVVKPQCACGAELRPDAKFCRACGKTRCKGCGSSLTPDAVFCDTCGRRHDDTSPVAAAMPPAIRRENLPSQDSSHNGIAWPEQHDTEGARRDRDDFFFHPAKAGGDPRSREQMAR